MPARKKREATVFEFMSNEIAAAPHMKPGQSGTDLHLPGTDDLTSRIKVYTSGGENEMHSHPKEDHAFYVLQGQATFHIERDDNSVDVPQHSGILLPKGTKYWFTNTGPVNLVLLRVGSSAKFAFFRHDADENEIVAVENFPHLDGRILV